MMYLHGFAKYLVLLITCLILVSCSSGDEVTGTGAKDVQGTAADKEKLQDNDVVLRDKKGDTKTATTDEQGEFYFDVAGLTPPYLIMTVTESGTLYSIATSDGVANISPLSNVIVRNWFSVNGSDIDSVFASQDENLRLPSATEINNLVAAISNLISTVYTSFNLSTNYDFIHDQASDDFINMLANTTVILANNQLSITIETPPPSQQVVSILIAFNFSDDLSDDTTIAPSQPEGLSATTAEDAIQLLWNVSRDNVGVSYYNIYSSDQIDGVYAFLADSTAAHYSHTQLPSGTQYCYQVEAVDASGRISLMSSPICATTASPPQCGDPSGYEPLILGESKELTTYWATQVAEDSTTVYSWSLDAKPDDDNTLELGPFDVSTPSFTFTPTAIGIYAISLEITADSLPCTGAGGSWTIEVIEPIVAVAGDNFESNLGIPALLDGSASTGPASPNPLWGEWSILSGPPGYFPFINQNPPLLQATYTPNLPGSYEFQLEVQGGYNDTATDSVILTVPAPSGSDLLPVANGGLDRTATIGQAVILDSSASYDPNDPTATIIGSWYIYSSPLGLEEITIVSDTQSEFTPQSLGDYVLQLSVQSNGRNSHSYFLTITVTQ